ncbi:TPA: ABC transporter substrate-binding protein, partial [archaeon]|nr:ABC transporter substrate-binding protein [Candidatus Naiadarchaeales archaeon SRR2090153.bin461]
MRIVSLAPSNTEILYALGCGAQIVANTRYCDYPDDAKKKEKVGSFMKVDVPKIVDLKPDVVMTSTFLQDETAVQCKKAGLKVFHVDPKTLDHVFQSIMSIGEFVNRKSRALKLVNEMRSGFLDVRTAVMKRQKIKVYCEEDPSPPRVSGNWVP